MTGTTKPYGLEEFQARYAVTVAFDAVMDSGLEVERGLKAEIRVGGGAAFVRVPVRGHSGWVHVIVPLTAEKPA